jgi:3-keto-5-aminohexanoate cleavage enzyme
MSRKVIITCALTGGIQTKKANPNLPEQPSEIAQQAYECFNEGCAVAHIHARDKSGIPTGDTEVLKKFMVLLDPNATLFCRIVPEVALI